MITNAKAKFIRRSPRKVRLVADLVRGMKAMEAKKQLLFSSKGAAEDVLNVLNSAVANAKSLYGVNPEDLRVTKIMINEGPTIKRYTPRAQGRATMIRKRMSHILIEVSDGKGEEKPKKVAAPKKTNDQKKKEDKEESDVKVVAEKPRKQTGVKAKIQSPQVAAKKQVKKASGRKK